MYAFEERRGCLRTVASSTLETFDLTRGGPSSQWRSTCDMVAKIVSISPSCTSVVCLYDYLPALFLWPDTMMGPCNTMSSGYR